MEHLSTSFFRSSVAGSFKEHRMVFQGAPARLESVAVAEQRQKEMLDRLNNPNDVQAAADARVLKISIELSRDLDTTRMDAFRDALDARIKTREDAERDVTALRTEHENFRKTEGTALAPAVGPARDPIVTRLLSGPTPPANRGSLLEAMNKVRELASTPAASRGIMHDRFIAQYRDHIRELQNLSALNPAEKAKMTSPYSSETAADAPSKMRLGRAYLKGETGVDVVDVNTYKFRRDFGGGNVIEMRFIWNDAAAPAGQKWTIDVASPAVVAVADIAAATNTFDAAPFNAAPWNTDGTPHKIEVQRLKGILENMKNGVVTPGANLEAVQKVANAKESTDAQTAIDTARKAQADFLANDADAGWSGLVRRLRAAERDGLTDAARGRKEDIRALGNTRKQEIYTAIDRLNTSTPPNDTAIKSSKYVEHMNLLIEQLTDIDQRVAKLTNAPAATPAPETLPDAERKSLEAFNKFLNDNAAVNGLTDAEGTRKPAIDAIVAQLPTLNASEGLRKQGRAALEAKLASKGYSITAIEFSPARLEIRRTAESTPATPEVTTFLGTETERNTLRDALRNNVGNLDVPAVRDAIAVFQKRLAAVPAASRRDAVNRLADATRTPATPTAEGVEVAAVADGDSFRLEARRINRTPGTPPPAAERKERNERLSEFIKIIIELIRALIQVEQARNASIDRFLTRSLENQQKFMADMQAQMKAFPPAGRRTPAQDAQYRQLEARYKEAQGQIKTLEARVKELESRHEAAVKAAGRTRTLEVRWSDDDRRCARPPVVCVRRDVRVADAGVAAQVSADIQVVRNAVPLVATTVPAAAAPNRAVPTTAFYVGSVNIDNRATTTVNNINSPGSTISASSTATTNVAPPPRIVPSGTPPPPPRIIGSGPAREGSLNG